MLNSITIMGRLTRDPELKRTKAGTAVCTITLAVDRDYRDENDVREADFIDVVCWRGTAEHVARWFRKGLLVAVEGRLQSRRWKDQYQQNRVSFEVVADSVYFAERAERGDGQRERQGPGTQQSARHGPQRSDLRPVDVRNADVFPENDGGDYAADLYRLPSSDFEEFDDDGDVPF